MNIDHWLLPLPLNNEQEIDFFRCQSKLQSLCNLPLRIHCLSSETLWTNPMDPTVSTMNHRNPLKMYWQRNLNELRLFLKPNREQINRLDANIIEIHQRRRVSSTRCVKQDMIHSSVMISFSPHSTSHHHLLLLTIKGKRCLLEFQIPSIDTDVIYRGTYRKIGEDTQLRTVTALFNCTIDVDDDMTILLSEYGLC
jgi:hypothetical protein